MKILVTGFAPFGGQTINPAYEAVKIIPESIGRAEIVKAEIPVVFGRDMEVLEKLLEQYRPEAVICVGQAGGRAQISLERVGINVMDASAPDNEGNQPVDEPVVEGGPAAYFATLPLRKMEASVKAEGIPCQISNSAGTYVCNDILYRVLHKAACEMPAMKAGFIHVPFLPEQAAAMAGNYPSMSVEMIGRALEAAIRVLI